MLSLRCWYPRGYKGYKKHWCRGPSLDACCKVVEMMGEEVSQQHGQVSIRDSHISCVVLLTAEDLSKVDAGSYWCVVERMDRDLMEPVTVRVVPGTPWCPAGWRLYWPELFLERLLAHGPAVAWEEAEIPERAPALRHLQPLVPTSIFFCAAVSAPLAAPPAILIPWISTAVTEHPHQHHHDHHHHHHGVSLGSWGTGRARGKAVALTAMGSSGRPHASGRAGTCRVFTCQPGNLGVMQWGPGCCPHFLSHPAAGCRGLQEGTAKAKPQPCEGEN